MTSKMKPSQISVPPPIPPSQISPPASHEPQESPPLPSPSSKVSVQLSSPLFQRSPSPPPSPKSHLPLESVTVVLSDSPTKVDENLWIPSLNLTHQDRAILQTNGTWLNDNIISAAHMLLKSQCDDGIEGFQNTQLGKKLAFVPIPPYTKYIQILHVDGNHWNVVSNIKLQGGVFSDSVCIYDSLKTNVSLHTKKQICSFFQPRDIHFFFDLVNVQRQPNVSDCGLFAIAFATELAHKKSPVLCDFDTQKMRHHLLSCFENNDLTRFPLRK